jgi:hypothetical protein
VTCVVRNLQQQVTGVPIGIRRDFFGFFFLKQWNEVIDQITFHQQSFTAKFHPIRFKLIIIFCFHSLSDFGLKLSASMESSKSLIFHVMNREDQERQSVFSTIKELRVELTLATLQLENGDIGSARTHLNGAYEKVDVLEGMNELRPSPKRSGNIAGILEEMVKLENLT